MRLTIAYWNTAGRNGLASIALNNSQEFDILAIQEPWYNKQIKTVYCPAQAKYRRIFSEGRAALYIHKRHPLNTWAADAGPDWCKVTLQGTTIWSIYSPIPTNQQWVSPLQKLAGEEPMGHQIIVGDLNLHHPLWDREGRTTPESSTLLRLARKWHLNLATPWGEPTRQRHNERDSTIDHAWTSASLQVQYHGDLGYEGSDHRAQLIEVNFTGTRSRQPRAALVEGWSWKRMDSELVAIEAQNLYITDNLSTPERLELAVEHLTTQLIWLANATTPRRKTNNGHSETWWSQEVEGTIYQARGARRRYKASPTNQNWRLLQEASSQQLRTIQDAKTKNWRQVVAEASKDSRRIWNLEKWARLRSHCPPDPLILPPLQQPDTTELAISHSEKAAILAQRFFPESIADLSNIRLDLQDYQYQRFPLSQAITQEEVANILYNTGAWKAPGTDLLPIGFLKACGPPLATLLARIVTASLQLEHFPKQFRVAKVIVLRKPGKTIQQQQTAGAYRPISLLNTMGKIIEAAISQRIAAAAEEQGLLPELQMGNRPQRSTELAVKAVVDITHTAWSQKAVTSLLQLDIKGAFDTVNHTRLLDTLQQQGFPLWTVRWVKSFLTGRTANLHFDGETAAPRQLVAGVPQGSPLSPILFLLYTASLYTQLKDHMGIVTIGFADDLNLLAIGKNTLETRNHLEGAWQTCLEWARTRGMEFAPEKSELLHFTRAHIAPTTVVRLGEQEIHPIQEARFLGIWLDRKLKWKGHLAAVKRKFATQQFALSRLAASAWGCSLLRAREIYTKVIRSALSYGAGVWHYPTTQRQKGVAKQLATNQSQCLRIVSGAYRATPVRFLEVETATPPLDLYLNRRVADFERRLEHSGKGELIRSTCAGVAARLLRQRPRRQRNAADSPDQRRLSLEYGAGRTQWANTWTRDLPPKKALLNQWQQRWNRSVSETQAQRQRQTPPPAEFSQISIKALSKHEGLHKHYSSLLTQVRTGRVGLRAFLFERKVPDIATPWCQCGEGLETAAHLVLDCGELLQQRNELQRLQQPLALRTYRDFVEATTQPRRARQLVHWLLTTRRFPEFRLAERYRREEEEGGGRD
jgi:hypothetical protein